MNRPSSHPALSAPWGTHTPSAGSVLPLRIGLRDVWLRSEKGELRIAAAALPPPEGRLGREEAAARGSVEPPAGEPPDGVEWSRWALPSNAGDLMLTPALPDRTLVLEPESPFRLLPRAEARVYVRVPLWIRIELPLRDGTVLPLDELPTQALSDTWWGDFMEGELAYWLPTTARREMHPELHLPHLAVCPIRLSNRSIMDLRVEKVALRTAHLSLFQSDGRFWADETRVTYQGEAEGSQIDMAGKSPPEAAGAPRVTPPRTPALRTFRARTFARLRSLPTAGATQ